MALPAPFALYNPALLSPEALLGDFVARQPLLETLLNTVRENARDQAPQHVLLVGPRGMGKTTTLWAIAHRVNLDSELNQTWQPVVFDEESRRVGDLADFWLEAIRQWEHATEDPTDCAGKLLSEAAADIEDQAREAFLQAVSQSERRALLLIDNLNGLLSAIRDPEPLHRLRATLMEESQIMIVGGATRYFSEVTEVDQPFYDFFRAFELRPLELDEMKTCLIALAEKRQDTAVAETVKQREGTMRSLHLLTGGNPRLIKTFYRLLAEGLNGDVRSDLERLLDEFTPYFKSLVDALPLQQQRIFDAVALNWDPVDVATLARTTRLPSNQISAQLRTLQKSGFVTVANDQPKRKHYLLADRFSNIHYLMRHGRAARSRFDWFIAMLQLVFPDHNQATTIARLAHETAMGGESGKRDAHDLLHSALNRSATSENRSQILQSTFREAWTSETAAAVSSWLKIAEAKTHFPESDVLAFCDAMPIELRTRIGFKPKDAKWWHGLTDFLEQKEAWSLAEAAYRKAIALALKDAAPWNDLGNLLQGHLQRFDEAEEAYRKTIALDPKDAAPWNGLGNLFQVHLKRFDDAEHAYRKAIALDPKNAAPWNGLGNLLQDHLQRFDEAEHAYRNGLQLKPDYTNLIANLALLLGRLPNREKEAHSTIKRALLNDPANWNCRRIFLDFIASRQGDWQEILPELSKWCVKHPLESAVFEFVVEGFIQTARSTSPEVARQLLESIESAKIAFETLRDALIISANEEHLENLAPERRVAAIELMNRINSESPAASLQE